MRQGQEEGNPDPLFSVGAPLNARHQLAVGANGAIELVAAGLDSRQLQQFSNFAALLDTLRLLMDCYLSHPASSLTAGGAGGGR